MVEAGSGYLHYFLCGRATYILTTICSQQRDSRPLVVLGITLYQFDDLTSTKCENAQ